MLGTFPNIHPFWKPKTKDDGSRSLLSLDKILPMPSQVLHHGELRVAHTKTEGKLSERTHPCP